MVLKTLILCLCVPILLLLYKMKKQLNYWSSFGITQLNPSLLLGNIKFTVPLRNLYLEMYNQFKKKGVKHGGVYLFFLPIYMPLDLDIIKSIIVKNFETFKNRAVTTPDVKYDPLSANLVNLENEDWKVIRSLMTPTFSTGKLKNFFGFMLDSTNNLIEVFKEHSDNFQPVNAVKYSLRYNIDASGNYTFGIDCNSIKTADSEFVKYSERLTTYNFSRKIRMLVTKCTPLWFQIYFRIERINAESEKFFTKLINDTLSLREQSETTRDDLTQTMLQVKKSEIFQRLVHNGSGDPKDRESAFIIAQSFVIFYAGFELSATATSFAFYELAANPDIQERLRQEIETVLSKHQNEFTYESINKMTYLECIVKETLRKYPPAIILVRKCNSDFEVPGTDFVLKKGTNVHIPVIGLHMDPDYYPDPEKFDPCRFMTDQAQKPPFYPFGDGPRNCIGMRLGMLQIKVIIARAVRHFRFQVNKKTIVPFKWKLHTAVPSVEGGLWLDVEEIKC